MSEAEMQKRVQTAKSKIGAGMTMLFLGKDEQGFQLLKEALSELAPINAPVGDFENE